MKTQHETVSRGSGRKKTFTSSETLSRRELLAGSAAAGATVCLTWRAAAAAADGKKTFTILHTNDLHSNLDRDGRRPRTTRRSRSTTTQTRGGFARLATLIAKQKAARARSGSGAGA